MYCKTHHVGRISAWKWPEIQEKDHRKFPENVTRYPENMIQFLENVTQFPKHLSHKAYDWETGSDPFLEFLIPKVCNKQKCSWTNLAKLLGEVCLSKLANKQSHGLCIFGEVCSPRKIFGWFYFFVKNCVFFPIHCNSSTKDSSECTVSLIGWTFLYSK